MGKAVLICSGKGGVGKTTLAVNLGVCLARQGFKTCILDLNTGLRNDDIYLGLENNILFDLADVTSGLCKLEKALVKHDMVGNLYLLSGPQYRGIDGVTGSHARILLTKLKAEFDFVLADMPVEAGKRVEYIASGADASLTIVTQDYSCIRNSDTVNKRLANCGLSQRFFIVNKIYQDMYGDEDLPDLEFMVKNIAATCLGVIPFDYSIHKANNTGLPISTDENNILTKEFDKIAMQLV